MYFSNFISTCDKIWSQITLIVYTVFLEKHELIFFTI